MNENNIKGTLVISMDSDGDFGFNNLESIKQNVTKKMITETNSIG